MTLDEIKRESHVPVVLADHRGLITYVNGNFEEVFEWKAKEIVGLSLTTIIPTYLRDAHHLGLSRFLTTGVPTLLNRPLMLKAVTKTGREFDAEHTIVAEKHSGEWIFGATIRPISAGKPGPGA